MGMGDITLPFIWKWQEFNGIFARKKSSSRRLRLREFNEALSRLYDVSGQEELYIFGTSISVQKSAQSDEVELKWNGKSYQTCSLGWPKRKLISRFLKLVEMDCEARKVAATFHIGMDTAFNLVLRAVAAVGSSRKQYETYLAELADFYVTVRRMEEQSCCKESFNTHGKEI